MAGGMNPGEAFLAALAGLTAYKAGSPKDELLAIAGQDPGEAFLAALAIAGRLTEEVRNLGGDPNALLTRIYGKASELAYS